MYYLLEDNRIIDSEKLKRKLHFDAKIGIIDNELIVTLENFPIFRSENKIEKQSQNVFDFIEIGDLVKCEQCDGVFEVSDINFFDKEDKERYGCNKSFISYPAGAEHLEIEISIIYKLDSQGNYIKVWEKKDA